MARISRDSSIPHNARTTTPPTEKTSAPQPHSRLPRRLVTPTCATPTSRFASSSVAERIANAERAASESRSPLDTKHITPSTRVGVKKSTSAVSDNKPLLHEKPLPSRPTARLTNMPSPSKDGRTLVDATDRPLHITTPDGERREWPALTPSSARSMSISSTTDPKKPEGVRSSIRPVVSPSPVTAPVLPAKDIAAVTSMEQPADRGRSLSGTSSYATALDRPSAVASTSTSAVAMPAAVAANATVNAVHKRGASLTRHSLQNIRTYQQNQKNYHAVGSKHTPARSASVGPRFRSGTVITTSHSHKISDSTRIPSAARASSRPTSRASSREPSSSPANFSRPRRGSTSSSIRFRSIKTASRIPITDTKKATIVNVKQDRSSDPSKTQSSDLPRFGSRRLASPEALKVLENGKVRRQMKLEKGELDTNHAPLQRTATNASDASTLPTPSLSYSFDTSPEGTTAPGSPQGFIVDGTAPASGSHFNLRHSAKRDTGVKMSNEDLRKMFTAESGTRAPPSKNPFTAPLPTIESQAVLPTDPSGFHDAGEEDLLRALSHLEGKGSPPKTDVDQETLRSMFGHLKRGKEGSRPDTSPLHQNAAAAERFLALESDGLEEMETTTAGAKRHIVDQIAAPRPGIAVSKWSTSTPSDKPEDGALLSQSGRAGDGGDGAIRHSSSSKEIVSSIGWPSVVPNDIVPHVNDDDATAATSVDSRRSSPTLGEKRYQGSVRAARAGLRAAPPSFARTTTAAQSRKTSKLPAPSSRFELPDRGRTVSSSTTTRDTVRSKTPQSRSKSRIVLDKINGFFSGNREKKEVIPPVPQIDESYLPSKVRTRPSITHLGPAPAMPTRPAPPVPPRPSQIPKMPSLSPFLHTSPRTASPSTVLTDDATLVDRITLKNESQQSMHALAEHLLAKSRAEKNLVRKQRLLTFAQVLNNSMMSVREAAISAETARTAANDTRMHYEMTLKGLNMVQRLAASVAKHS